MDKEVQEIIEFVSKSNFVEFELEKDGIKIKLVKAQGRMAPTSVPAPTVYETASPDENLTPGSPVPAPAAGSGLHEIRSPLVGTFYRAPNPEAATFTDVGQQVKTGQVLCIVEAMKLMNEIESDVDGVVEEVVIANGQPVEYGEVLFRIRPLPPSP